MRNKIFVITILVVGMLGACAGPKKATTKTEKIVPVGQAVILTEEKKMEFEYLFVEGLKLKMTGNVDAARQYFNGCLEINPNAAAVMYELAQIYVQKGDFTGANLLLEKAIQINSENKWYKILLAQLYQRNQEFQKASEIYISLIEKEPENTEYYYLNALSLSTAKQYDEAIKAFNQLEKVMGYNPQIALARKQVYQEAGKSKNAYAEMERLIKVDPTVSEFYGVLADMYREDNNMTKALEYYQKVLEIDPSNGFVHFSLANFHIQNKNPKAAYEHAITAFSDPEQEIVNKIQLYLMFTMGMAQNPLSPQQIDTLTQAITLAHPDDPRGFGIRADYLLNNGMKQEARDFIAQAVEKSPDNYELWEQLIMLDSELGDNKQLVDDTERAIKLFPSQPLLYLFQGMAFLMEKDYTNTLKSLQNGITYVIDNPKMEAQYHLYMAEAYYNLKQPQKAFEAFDKTLALEPGNFMAMNNYAYYLSVRNENLEKAEKLSAQVVQAHPDNSTYLDTHAWVLFKKKEYRLAKFYMEIALKNGGDQNDVIVEHFGDILYMLNDKDEALKFWNKAIELGGDSEILKKKIAEEKYFEEEAE